MKRNIIKLDDSVTVYINYKESNKTCYIMQRDYFAAVSDIFYYVNRYICQFPQIKFEIEVQNNTQNWCAVYTTAGRKIKQVY